MRIEVELSGDDEATAELADRLHDWIETLWPHARIRVDYGLPGDSVKVREESPIRRDGGAHRRISRQIAAERAAMATGA